MSLELPLVVIDIQRGGPSAGLPTKTEAADLMMAMYGRHGEAPMPIVARVRPLTASMQRSRRFGSRSRYRTPVMLLSDGYLANGTEPWKLPDIDSSADRHRVRERTQRCRQRGREVYWPYVRNDDLARPWAIPGTEALMHRIGGIESRTARATSATTRRTMSSWFVFEKSGSSRSPTSSTTRGDGRRRRRHPRRGMGLDMGCDHQCRRSPPEWRHQGRQRASAAPLPFAPNLGELLQRFDHVVVPEMNLGQLTKLLRAEFLVDAKTISKVSGQPFTAAELVTKIQEVAR